jgi:hypothetical protein
MPLKVYAASDLPKIEWSKLTGHSIFSSPEFASLWRTMGGRDVFLVLEESGAIKAGMAGVVFGGRFARRFQSMPDGTFGGPYFSDADDAAVRRQFMTMVHRWLISQKIIRADIHRPRCEIESDVFERRETTTQTVALEGKTYQPPSSKVREHIRSARRRGGRLAIMDDERRLDEFYSLVLATEKRHGESPRYPIGFFRELLNISPSDSRILWLMVLSDNRMIGSRICFIENFELLTWQYYSDKRYSHLKPGYILLDHIFNYALEHGIRTVNLGWTPPGVPALADYKERWGGRTEVFPYHTYLSRLGRLIYRWRRA